MLFLFFIFHSYTTLSHDIVPRQARHDIVASTTLFMRSHDFVPRKEIIMINAAYFSGKQRKVKIFVRPLTPKVKTKKEIHEEISKPFRNYEKTKK